MAVDRFAVYSSLALIFGVGAFTTVLAPERVACEIARGLRLLVDGAVTVFVVGTLLWLPLEAGQITGAWGGAFQPATHSHHRASTEKSRIVHSPMASSGEITALMPGKLLSIDVAVGDTVSEKQPVATMESMKMETTLHAPISGRVTEIRCQPGQVVDMGEILIVIEDQTQ